MAKKSQIYLTRAFLGVNVQQRIFRGFLCVHAWVSSIFSGTVRSTLRNSRHDTNFNDSNPLREAFGAVPAFSHSGRIGVFDLVHMTPVSSDVFLPPRLSWIFNLPENERTALDFLRGYSGRGFYSLPGVYFLWYDFNLVYIGKSDRSVSCRVDTHYREGKKEFNAASAFYAQTPDEIISVGELETELINRFYPKYNAPFPHRECAFCDRALGGVSFYLNEDAGFCGKCMRDFQVFELLQGMGLITPEGETTRHWSMWTHVISRRLSERNSILSNGSKTT